MTIQQVKTTVADLSYLPLSERRAYPWAVSVGEGTDTDTVIRFDNLDAARLFVTLMGTESGVRRWVALTEPEWQGVPM